MEKKDKFNFNINVVNKSNFSTKKRIIGIDFIRILAMYSIVIDHLLIHGKIIIKFNHYKKLNLLIIICFWHVDSFALIIYQKKMSLTLHNYFLKNYFFLF